MASALSKRLEKLEAVMAARTEGPKTVRRVLLGAGTDLPTEAPDELLIVRAIVTPPERPTDEPLPETTQAVSPRIEHADGPVRHGDRTPIEIQRDERRFHRQLDYPTLGPF